MNGESHGNKLLLLVLALAVGSAGAPQVAVANEDMTPRPQRVFTEKPRIEDYDDYGAFLVEIMEYRRQKEERSRRLAEEAASRPAAEPESPLARDPYNIRQPESLEEALERARYIQHPVYSSLLRYDRTTSQSFPLEHLETPDMSAAELAGHLADPGSGRLAIFEDDGAERKAASKTGSSDPTGEDSARETRASADSFSISSASFDADSKWAVDADGRRYYLQISNSYSEGYTVGSRTDILLRYLFVDIEVEPLR